ncbi:MAG: hypothetical protein U0872_14690 [Planctomycetaceae bacterium]
MDHVPVNRDERDLIHLPPNVRSTEGLDLHVGRNFRQSLCVITGVMLGTVIGGITARPAIIPGALLGAFFGLLIGTFFGGMRAGRSARTETVSRQQLELRIAAIDKLYRWCLPGSVMSMIMGLICLPFIVKATSEWAFVLVILILTVVPGMNAYTGFLAQRLLKYRQLLAKHAQHAEELESPVEADG